MSLDRISLDRIFVGFMIVVGVVIGAVVAQWPEMREARIPPYMWVLLLMLLFEGAVFALRGVSPGSAISMPARLIAFAAAAVLVIAIPSIAGTRMF